MNQRELAGVGFAMDPADLPSIKKEINIFLEEVVAKYSKNKKKKKEVYHLELALFSLSHGQETNGEKSGSVH